MIKYNQKQELISTLLEFCHRVANVKTTNERETEVLPQVAKMLLEQRVIRNEDE